MKSMTGFAAASLPQTNNNNSHSFGVTVELKSYNSRYLDIFINVPPAINFLEKKLRDMVAQFCKRGKIEACINLPSVNSGVSYKINKDALQSAITVIQDAALQTLQFFRLHDIKNITLNKEITIKDILAFENVVETVNADTSTLHNNDAGLTNEILIVFKQALTTLDNERKREGVSTQNDILQHLDSICKMVNSIKELAPDIEAELQKSLEKRFAEIIGSSNAGVEENRILAEVAVLLNKYTINEELSRLDAHLAEFRACVLNEDAPGKKLDFLCQEINRETNTIGSKTPNIEVSHYVVNIKDACENIREQVRNIE
jgi:uncharacterized protein (TIGR00255 family)